MALTIAQRSSTPEASTTNAFTMRMPKSARWANTKEVLVLVSVDHGGYGHPRLPGFSYKGKETIAAVRACKQCLG